jgi:YidC/Oxa1 family membrane protein insertase
MFGWIAKILAGIYELVPSYGGAIILLTLGVMLILTPFTLKGTRSMMAMQQLQPEMKRLQQKYKGDRQKLNEEMMKFYKENQINPLGGCLPLLIQMPVFIVLYQVIQGLTRMGEDGNFDPKYISHTSDLYQDLSATDQMMFFGLDLAESASEALSESFTHGLPYLLLIGIVAATGWYQQRQMTARRVAMGSSAPVDPAQAQQQAIMKWMWVILPVFSWAIPAGVVLYFVVSNLYRVGQQAYIQRTMFGGGDGSGNGSTPSTSKPSGGSGAAKERQPASGGTRAAAPARPRKKKKKR